MECIAHLRLTLRQGSLAPAPTFSNVKKSFLTKHSKLNSPSYTEVGKMKLTTDSSVPVYTIAGEGTARPLPEWLARKRKRSLKKDSEYANRVELLQDFEFEEASQCVRISEDGEWVMSTGLYFTGSVRVTLADLLTG